MKQVTPMTNKMSLIINCRVTKRKKKKSCKETGEKKNTVHIFESNFMDGFPHLVNLLSIVLTLFQYFQGKDISIL